jgi:hypothetical protein
VISRSSATVNCDVKTALRSDMFENSFAHWGSANIAQAYDENPSVGRHWIVTVRNVKLTLTVPVTLGRSCYKLNQSNCIAHAFNDMHPPIQIFLTTIASQPALRQRQGVYKPSSPILSSIEPITDYLLRILQVKKIQFTSYDLASDENAKRLWKRKAPAGEQGL